VALALDDAQFESPSFWQRYSQVIIRNSGAVLPLLVFGWLYRRWLSSGKDMPLEVVVNEFVPPSNLRPAALGVIEDFYSNNQDISATIIDLAQRGYVTIIDKTKKETAKKRKLSFRLENADFGDLQPFEIELMDGLFEKREVGTIVELKALKNKFYTHIHAAQAMLYKHLTDEGYFYENPAKVRTKYIAVGSAVLIVTVVAAIFLGLFLQAPGLLFGLIGSGILVLLFASAMTKRSSKGHKAWQEAAGLKRYMSVAEKDRIAMLQSPGSQYARSAEGSQEGFTVDLYEKLLPYAVVFQIEEAWTKQFEGILTGPPDWYETNNASFSPSLFASQLGSGVTQMRSTMTSTPSSSSSGGSRGGGFSGGGVGGGGGSSW
jgi:uncharacterized membrane protein